MNDYMKTIISGLKQWVSSQMADLESIPMANVEGLSDALAEKKANPYAITFTGAVTGTYDGSEAVSIDVPTIAGPQGVGVTNISIVEI